MFFYFVVWTLPISELLEPPCRHLCRMIFLLFTRRYNFNIFHNQYIYLIPLQHFSFAKPNQG